MKKQAPAWIAAVAILVVIGGTLFWVNRRSSQPTPITSAQPSERHKPESEKTAASARPSAPRAPEPEPTRPVDTEPTRTAIRLVQPPAVVENRASAQLKGSGEKAVLTDAKGKPLLEATPSDPIYSVTPSPSGKQILVTRGNGVHELYRMDPFEFVREMPLKFYDMPRASAFEPWNWIDETTLMTALEVERPAAEQGGLTAAERESATNWRESTMLYSVKLLDRKFTRIDTAKAGLPPSFRVVEMQPGGLVKVEWDENGIAQTAWVGVGR